MRYTRILPLLIIALIIEINISHAQEVCGTDDLHKSLLQSNPEYKKLILQQEKDIKEEIIKRRQAKLDDNAVYTIPLVVHVIHKGEAIGSGSNISDNQIYSAIQGVNERFRKIIGDGADMKLEFCLAGRDPEGNPTNGINRVNGNVVANYSSGGITYKTDDPCEVSAASQIDIKALSRWPAKDYYNIWIVHKICPNSVAGYAYLPTFSNMDGAVILSNYMTYNSVTVAHEIAHGLGLYHTFNEDDDNQCPLNEDCLAQGDGVCDTPPHRSGDCGNSNPCTSEGTWDNSRRNYMSYCGTRTRFTEGQKERMRAFLNISPRANLLKSLGCASPLGVEIELSDILFPTATGYVCNTTQKPVIKVKNLGSEDITSLKSQTTVNNQNPAEHIWNGLLASGDSIEIELNEVSFPSDSNRLYIEITESNGGQDNFSGNNFKMTNVYYETPVDTLFYNFNDGIFPPEKMKIIDEDDLYSWELTMVPCKGQVATVQSYNRYADNNTSDIMVLPAVDLSNYEEAQLVFDLAYKRTYSNRESALRVLAQKDCSGIDTIYNKTRNNLATVTGYEYSPWEPASCDDWRTEVINLNDYIGSAVQLNISYFIEDTYGQNIYIDNIHVRGKKASTCETAYNEIDADICEGSSYTLPNNDIVWEAGEYQVILTSSTGCDSIITVNISVNKTSSTRVNAIICEGQTYTLPDGNTASESGVYISDLLSTLGCDSTVAVSLTVQSISQINLEETVCYGSTYILPDGVPVSQSDTYKVILLSSTGCDSVIHIQLTVLDEIHTNVQATICDGASYTLPDGSEAHTSGSYSVVIPSSENCDSTITVELTVLEAPHTTVSATICSGVNYTLPDGQTVNESGTYTVTLSSDKGCDSVIVVQLSVIDVYSSNVFIEICEGDSFILPDDTEIYQDGIYPIVLTASNGCDSTITTYVKVHAPEKPVITQEGLTLISSYESGNQWYKDGEAIPGAVQQNYEATYSGVYYVKYTDENGCEILSDEIEVLPVSLKEKLNGINLFQIYPNPNNGYFTIQIESGVEQKSHLEIVNILGQVLDSRYWNNISGKITIYSDLSSYDSGIYFVNLYLGEHIFSRRVIVQ